MTSEAGKVLTYSPQRRLLALDALRGLSIAAMFLSGRKSPIPQFRHGQWFEYTLADLVYPLFLFVVGFSMFLSTVAKDSRGIAKSDQAVVMVKRVATLFGLGVFLRTVPSISLQFTLGTLQCIALASLLAYPFVRLPQAAKMSVIAAIFTVVLALSWTLAGGDGDSGLRWTKGCTAAESLDRLILGEPRGIEGTLTTVAVVPLVLAGQAAARFYCRIGVGLPLIIRFFAAGLLLLFSGHFFESPLVAGTALFIPLETDLATPSFVLAAIGWSLMVFALLLLVIEQMNYKSWAHPLVVLGSNAIAVYAAAQLSRKLIFSAWSFEIQGTVLTLKEHAERFFAEALGPGTEQLAEVSWELGVALMLAYLLWWRKIFVRL